MIGFEKIVEVSYVWFKDKFALKLLHLFVTLIFLGLVWLAPNKYSFTFCLTVFGLFFIQNIILFSQKQYKNIVSFEFFFAISFFLCNFAYPVFYYPVNPYINIYGTLYFNENVINYGTALAGFSYSSFVSGLYFKKSVIVQNFQPIRYLKKIFISLIIISFISFMGYIIFGGLEHLKSVYRDGGEGDLAQVGIFSYFYNIFTYSTLLVSMFLFRIKNKIIRFSALIYILLISVLMLATGSRTLILNIVLILLVTYSLLIKKISKIKILITLFFGTFLLYLIVLNREYMNLSNIKLVDESNTFSFLDMYLDLIITTRNLYVLIDYTDTHFNIYFTSILDLLFSPVPGLSRLLENLGLPIELMGGASTTFLEFGKGSKYGLGTNIVGEMYFGFGIFGVFVISFLIGYIIRFTKNRLNNEYMYIIYFLLTSHAIFYPRAIYLFSPRELIWSILLFAFLKKIVKS